MEPDQAQGPQAPAIGQGFFGTSDYSVRQQQIIQDQQAQQLQLLKLERAYKQGRLNVSYDTLSRLAATFEASVGRKFGDVGYAPSVQNTHTTGDAFRAKAAGAISGALFGLPELAGAGAEALGMGNFWRDEFANLDEHPELANAYENWGWGGTLLSMAIPIAGMAGLGAKTATRAGTGALSGMAARAAERAGLSSIVEATGRSAAGKVGRSALSGALMGGTESAVDYSRTQAEQFSPEAALSGALMGGALGGALTGAMNSKRMKDLAQKMIRRRNQVLRGMGRTGSLGDDAARGLENIVDDVDRRIYMNASKGEKGALYRTKMTEGKIGQKTRGAGSSKIRDEFDDEISDYYYRSADSDNGLGRNTTANRAAHSLHNDASIIDNIDKDLAYVDNMPWKDTVIDDEIAKNLRLGKNDDEIIGLTFGEYRQKLMGIRDVVKKRATATAEELRTLGRANIERRAENIAQEDLDEVIEALYNQAGAPNSKFRLRGTERKGAFVKFPKGQNAKTIRGTGSAADNMRTLMAITGNKEATLKAIKSMDSADALRLAKKIGGERGVGAVREAARDLIYTSARVSRSSRGAINLERKIERLGGVEGFTNESATEFFDEIVGLTDEAVATGKLTSAQADHVLDELSKQTGKDEIQTMVGRLRDELETITSSRDTGYSAFLKNKNKETTKFGEFMDRLKSGEGRAKPAGGEAKPSPSGGAKTEGGGVGKDDIPPADPEATAAGRSEGETFESVSG